MASKSSTTLAKIYEKSSNDFSKPQTEYAASKIASTHISTASSPSLSSSTLSATLTSPSTSISTSIVSRVEVSPRNQIATVIFNEFIKVCESNLKLWAQKRQIQEIISAVLEDYKANRIAYEKIHSQFFERLPLSLANLFTESQRSSLLKSICSAPEVTKYDHPIFAAIKSGNGDEFSNLLSKIDDINKASAIGCQGSPLIWAILYDQKEMVSALLENGASIDSKHWNGSSALHVAINQGNVEIIALLLSKTPDLTALNSEEMNPLEAAIRKGDETIIAMLVEAEGKIRDISKIADADTIYETFSSNAFLLEALIASSVAIEDPAFIERFLELSTQEGKKPMPKVVEAMAKKVIASHTEPLLKFIDEGNKHLVDLCLKTMTDISAEKKLALLMHAVERAKPEIAQRIAREPEIASYLEAHPTGLHLAVETGIESLITPLLSQKDVNGKLENGNTPLHIAFLKKNLSIANLLKMSGAKSNISNNEGLTALELELQVKIEIGKLKKLTKEKTNELVTLFGIEALLLKIEEFEAQSFLPETIHDPFQMLFDSLSKGSPFVGVPLIVNIEGNRPEIHWVQPAALTCSRQGPFYYQSSVTMPTPGRKACELTDMQAILDYFRSQESLLPTGLKETGCSQRCHWMSMVLEQVLGYKVAKVRARKKEGSLEPDGNFPSISEPWEYHVAVGVYDSSERLWILDPAIGRPLSIEDWHRSLGAPFGHENTITNIATTSMMNTLNPDPAFNEKCDDTAKDLRAFYLFEHAKGNIGNYSSGLSFYGLESIGIKRD